MSTRRKRKKKQASKLPSRDLSAQTSGRELAYDAARREPGAFRRWVRAKRPVLGFVLLFAILMGVFYSITFLPVMNLKVFPAYMRFNAQASVVILNVFGEGADTRGTMVTSPRFSVDIQHGCDAIEPSALFIAAVLAFPASIYSKLPGLLLGTVALGLVNLIRIVTLFYTGIYYPRAFESMHVDVWQPIFILLALVFWVMWAWWATRSRTSQSDVSGETA